MNYKPMLNNLFNEELFFKAIKKKNIRIEINNCQVELI